MPRRLVNVLDQRTEAQEHAAVLDQLVESYATDCNTVANQTGDPRWNDAAVAFRGMRRLFRPLMHDDDRKSDATN